MDKFVDILQAGETYHIYNRANGREILFKERANYIYFLTKFIQYTNPFCEIFCYCLLPNHFHFLVRIKSEKELTDFKYSSELSQPFSNLFNAYSKAYNKIYNRKGSLFMRPFKRVRVDSDSYFTKLIHYVHANPVHHGYNNN